jgi:aryl-alcohol dehydrogenase-like predicted oxidoreductase
MMKKVRIARTDLRVSRLCLGTNMFGTATDADRALRILDAFVAEGGNFLDTAHSYGDWIPNGPRSASERVIGQWLAKRKRDDLVVATKGCDFDYRAGDYKFRLTPELLDEDLRGSLECLQLDRIDLYWLHRDDPAQPVEGILGALIEHQRAGRIRWFGCSNWTVARIESAQAHARRIAHPGFVACQPMWGLAVPDRDAIQRIAPRDYYEDGYAAPHAAGLTMIPYSAQSRGFFTKLAAGGEKSLREDLAARYLNDANRRKLPVLESIAVRHRATLNEVVLAYLLSQPLPTIPIIGCSTPEQLRESLRACEISLAPGELAELRSA